MQTIHARTLRVNTSGDDFIVPNLTPYMASLTGLAETPEGPRLRDVQTIGGNIRRLMKRAGLGTQSGLAARLRVSQPQASDWINDRYQWSDAKIGTLVKIAVALQASVDELIAGTVIGRDLIRHAPEYQSALPQGGAGVPASATQARILEELERLRTENAELQATLSDVRDLASKLFAIAVPSDEGGETAQPASARRRDARKAGGRSTGRGRASG